MTATQAPGLNKLLPCGTSAARRRHIAHGRPCHVCWPDSGLPAMPSATAPTDWRVVLLADEFGTDVPEEFAA